VHPGGYSNLPYPLSANTSPGEPGSAGFPAVYHLFWKRSFGVDGAGFYKPDALLVTQPAVSKH